MKSLWAPPEAKKGDTGLRVNAHHLVARSHEYDRRAQERGEPTGEHPTPGVGESLGWTPPRPDIEDASELFEFLSPQVRRLAIAIEAGVREPDWAREMSQRGRPQLIYSRMLARARLLLEAVRHPGVVDRLVRPLPMDHADRNPRRVLNVLREAANIGCYLLLIADVCGALEVSDGS
jgi:hypothetical protein